MWKKGNKIVCPNCGAKFMDDQPFCPFCGVLNYKGAEEVYMDKLDDIRGNMDDLKDAPVEEAKRELKSHGKLLKRIGIVVVVPILLIGGLGNLINLADDTVNGSDAQKYKEEYAWKHENYAIMDEMYENGQYDELVEFFDSCTSESKPVWAWQHAQFCYVYRDIQELEEKYQMEDEYYAKSREYIKERIENEMEAEDRFTEEETEILASYYQRVLQENE